VIRIHFFSGKRAVNSPGFTLIEVIAVMTLMVIVAAVAIPKLVNLGTDVLAENDKFKTFVRHAQARAMNSSSVWGVSFSSGSYFLFQDGDTNNAVSMPGEDASTVNLPSGITISPTGIVSFDSWGRPYTDAAGTSLQNGPRTITLSGGGSSRSITITPNTGFIP
jgi:MSHA pilin protein MshC